MKKLVLISPGLPDGRVELLPSRLPVVLGRSHRSHLTIEDDLLSRLHSEIRMNNHDQFEIRDLDSTNLTIVNGHDVNSHVLQCGDLILLGETEIKVEIEPPDEDVNDKTTRDLSILPKHTDNSNDGLA
ncbi:MAG: FHA domain-containing protein [Fuerstiella sp.]|nr:FHA domain-containing protein [Fuerstiella sp.]MCP4506915.1 FHA domain-containing protein [Fuerstiella sp.]